jgi:glycosyltransferase involved in cell wall biosynthesis
LRIAFLTSEFVTEITTGGGLANYLNKMTRALIDAGHTPEVFVLSFVGPAVIEHNGVRVHRVHPQVSGGLLRWMWNVPAIRGLGNLRRTIRMLSGARQLAAALEARDREAPFDVVQSADVEAPGLCIKPRPGRLDIVRCSFPIEPYAAVDADRKVLLPGWHAHFELKAVNRAQIVYAPSQFAAEYYQNRLKRPVYVVRPPALIEHASDAEPVEGLPDRFLLHFGQLRRRKGTDWIAQALPLAWKTEPTLKLALAGKLEGFDLDQWRKRWGEHQSNVIYLGRLTKPKLYSTLHRATASVLPSLVDNLPNTVIESLTLGIPVIGSDGASIDELVEPGKTGELVPVNDIPALADAMVRAWRGTLSARPGFIWDSETARLMQPQRAVEALVGLIGVGQGQKNFKLTPNKPIITL